MEETKTRQKNHIGLVGLGYWGKNLLRNFHELDLLHTACDFDNELVEERMKAFPEVNFSHSFDEILENDEITAIAFATPASTHYEYVKKALLAGKDVFVEKPLALNVPDGEELVKLAEDEGRILMVGHILQYHSAVLKLKALLDEGRLGKIQYIYSNRLNMGKLRTEENILWSFAPHDISVILMLVGEEPLKIFSHGGDYVTNGIHDTTMTTMEFPGGVKGHIFVSWLHPFKEQKLVVVGSEAMAVFDDVHDEKLWIYDHKVDLNEQKVPVVQKADKIPVAIANSEPLKEELLHFSESIKNRTKPRTDGMEGLQVLKVLEAAEKQIHNEHR